MAVKNSAPWDYTRITGEMAQRSRLGDGLHKWVCNKTPGATEVVLTDTTLIYNIPEGKQIFIRKAWILLTSASDNCHGTLVSCNAVAGGGTPTNLDGCLVVHSAAAMYGSEHYERDYRVPIRVRYSDGARSISIKVNANDASTEISVGWQGWVESE